MVDILYQRNNFKMTPKVQNLSIFFVLFFFWFFLYIISIKGMGYFRKRLEVDARHSQ